MIIRQGHSVKSILATTIILLLFNAGLAAENNEKFQFGSYGRVNFSTTPDGEQGKPANVVSHGTRLEESSYAELNFRYMMNKNESEEFNVKTEFTLAMFDEFFHYTGDPTSNIAIRNLFAYAENVIPGLLGIWAGSRMYRGDDLYLFDYWPLDNLNTLGTGFDLTFGDNYLIGLHTGLNRLKDDYYFQEVWTTDNLFGATKMVYMDRQKSITSLLFQKQFFKLGGTETGFKFKLYSEFHYLPKGVLKRDDTNTYQDELLPADNGFLIGAQLGTWGFAPNAFANLFFKYARGLAAYGEMAIPYGLNNEKRTTDATEVVLATMLNYETKLLGLMFGGYFRYFKDADVNEIDLDDGWEFIFAVRPHIFITEHFHQLFELSYQMKNPFGLSPTNGQHMKPAVFKAAVIPALTWKKGSFSRPQLRLVLSASYQNDAAKDTYLLDDPRRNHNWELFLGVQAEWWFHSSYK